MNYENAANKKQKHWVPCKTPLKSTGSYLFSLVTVPLGLHQNTNLSTINHLTGVRSQVWIWLCDYKPFPDVII